MYHNILTQKNQPDYKAVKKIVKLLLEFIEADNIYFLKSADELKIGILLVILSNKNPYYDDEVYDYLWKVIKNHNEFSFCIFSRDLVKAETKNGNLFFVMNCNQTMLVYSEANYKPDIDLKKIKLKQLLEKSDERYLMWVTKSNVIGKDLKYHQRCDNHLMALYVLHQQLRYAFINISWLLTGECTPSESLERQQEYLRAFNNLLGKTFDPNKEEEWSVLKKLDCACETIQDGKESESVNAEDVASASKKLEWLKNEVRTLFQKCEERTKLIFEDYGK